MVLKVVSDGVTHRLVTETGEDIRGVVEVKLDALQGDFAMAHITLAAFDMEISARPGDDFLKGGRPRMPVAIKTSPQPADAHETPDTLDTQAAAAAPDPEIEAAQKEADGKAYGKEALRLLVDYANALEKLKSHLTSNLGPGGYTLLDAMDMFSRGKD